MRFFHTFWNTREINAIIQLDADSIMRTFRILKFSKHVSKLMLKRSKCKFYATPYFSLTRLQRGKKQQIENGSGAEDNGDSSHCSNASTHSNQEAGPSNKRTKTSDDSGLELDTNNATVAIDPVMDGASEIELVFRPHPTLMEKDDSAQTR